MRLALIVIGCATLLTTTAARAERPWDSPLAGDPAAVYQAAVEATDGYDRGVYFLLEENRCSFDVRNRLVRVYRVVARVTDASAVEGWSSVRWNFRPWCQDRPKIEARIYGPDGVTELDEKTIVEDPAYGDSKIYRDDRVVRAALPGVKVGVVVEYQITTTEHADYFAAGRQDRLWVGYNNASCENTRLVFDYPKKSAFQYRAHALPDLRAEKKEDGDRVRLVLETGPSDPLAPEESGRHPDAPDSAYVAWSTAASWEAVSKAYATIVEEALADFDAAALATKLAGDENDPRKVTDRCMDWIHANVRYEGIEIGRGSIVPRAPEKTLERHFGDCKDQATLLVALLRARGIESHVALIDSGASFHLVSDLPGFGVFDHAIVWVGGDDPFWVDPTATYSSSAYLPWTDQGRYALVASTEGRTIERTPELESAGSETLEEITLKIPVNGLADVTERTVATGANAIPLRFAGDDDDSSRRDGFASYMEQTYATKEFIGFDAKNNDRGSAPIELVLRAKGAGLALADGVNAAAAIQPLNAYYLLSDVVPSPGKERRTSDFLLQSPHVFRVRYVIVPPPGYSLVECAETKDEEIGPIHYRQECRVDENENVIVESVLDTGSRRRWTPEEYEQVARAVQAARDSEATAVVFQFDAENLARNGKFEEAIAELRKLSKAHPEEPYFLTKMSRMFLSIGLRDVAVEYAKRARKIGPHSATAHHSLGLALQHDAFGRLRRPGWERAAALESLRRAYELDPTNVEIAAELAILLDFGNDGFRYTSGSDLAASVEQYSRLSKDFPDTDLSVNHMRALFHSEKYDALIERADLLKSMTGYLYRVCGMAKRDGVEAAIRWLEKTVRAGGDQRYILLSAGDYLRSTRHYPEAIQLYERGAIGAPNATKVYSLIEKTRVIKRWDSTPLDAKDPEQAPLRFFAWLCGLLDEELEDAIAPTVLRVLEPVEDPFLSRFRSQIRSQSEQVGSPDMLFDHIRSNYAARVEGDEATGYRLTAPTLSGFYSTEGGKIRFLGARDQNGRGGPALEALRHLDAGNLDAAATWLDWTFEIMPGVSPDGSDRSQLPRVWGKGVARTEDQARFAALAISAGWRDLEFDRGKLEALLPSLGEDHRYDEVVDFLHCFRSVVDRSVDAEAEAAARRLEAKHRNWTRARHIYIEILLRRKKWEEARARLAEWMVVESDRVACRKQLIRVATLEGKIDEAVEIIEGLIADNEGDAATINNAAWVTLFREEGPRRSDLTRAQASLSDATSSSYLHTLATLHAELGNIEPAYRYLLEAIEKARTFGPEAHDWYVLGRIAEKLGEAEAARSMYERLRDEPSELGETGWLAKRRLAALKAKKNGDKGAEE